MGKFTRSSVAPHVPSSQVTSGVRVATAEGHLGWGMEPKAELFTLAAANLVGEDSFYESAGARDERYRDLVAEVTRDDPDWVRRLVPYLRDDLRLRSVPLVTAAEYARAGGPAPRGVIASALQRPDEPAELLAYWHQRYGRRVPQSVKRGVADAVVRMYDERAALRYDGQAGDWRMGDVIELTHPTPRDERQSALFRHLIDRRHNRDDARVPPPLLEVMQADAYLRAMEPDERRAYLREATTSKGEAVERGGSTSARLWHTAGWSWERLAGWLPGGMDAEAWEAVIPQMGLMALTRNLRNFDDAGVSDVAAMEVTSRFMDSDEVTRSRQLPIRFLSAWEAVSSLRWGAALEGALMHSLANVPVLTGRTLVLVDMSGSMQDRLSARTEVERWKVAALFGLAIAARAERADVYAYSNSHAKIELRPGAHTSLLRVLDEVARAPGMFGGTQTFQTLAATYSNHDRVIILTDEQAHPAYMGIDDVLTRIPRLYTFNLGGYRAAQLPHGQAGTGHVQLAGLSDAAFTLIPLIERARAADWPF